MGNIQQTPLRILHVVTCMDPAGIEVLLMTIYRNIDRSKIQFDFLVHRDHEAFFDKEIRDLGGRIFHVPSFNPFHHARYLKELNKFFESHNEYQIVHSHLNALSLYVLRSAAAHNIPVRIAHSHIANRPLDFKTPFFAYAKHRISKYATAIFACSKMAGEWLMHASKYPYPEVTVVHNGIELENFAFNESERKKIRAQLGCATKRIICHVGRFYDQKNHKFLIDVFQKLKELDQNTMLLLIGDGPLQKKIRKTAALKGLQEDVLFVGKQKNVAQYLNASDLFLFPSKYEGLGICLIEAQANGLPCIVSDVIPEEVVITDYIKMMSLRCLPEEWANVCLALSTRQNRIDGFCDAKKSSYNVKEVAEWLTDYYANSIKMRGGADGTD